MRRGVQHPWWIWCVQRLSSDQNLKFKAGITVSETLPENVCRLVPTSCYCISTSTFWISDFFKSISTPSFCSPRPLGELVLVILQHSYPETRANPSDEALIPTLQQTTFGEPFKAEIESSSFAIIIKFLANPIPEPHSSPSRSESHRQELTVILRVCKVSKNVSLSWWLGIPRCCPSLHIYQYYHR